MTILSDRGANCASQAAATIPVGRANQEWILLERPGRPELAGELAQTVGFMTFGAPAQQTDCSQTAVELTQRQVFSLVIKPATAGVPPDEKPFVWFSSNQHLEVTATPRKVGSVRRSMEDAARWFGVVRIGVHRETAPYDWKALKELSGMSSKMAAGMYTVLQEL